MMVTIALLAGVFFGFLVRNRMEGEGFFQYFASPSTNRLDLNWSFRQFLLLFNKAMSERWYEARAHLYQNVFVSILAALHLVHLVRIEYETSRENCISYVIVKTHGFQSFSTLKSKIPGWIKENKAQVADAQYWYQTFVCGRNVVGDCINGNF